MDQVDTLIQQLDDRHPDIAKRIRILWGMPDLTDILNELILPGPISSRHGFDQQECVALMELWDIHARSYPLRKTADQWGER